MAIGGAPISQMFADEIGADGYGPNASAGHRRPLACALASGQEAEAVSTVIHGDANDAAPTADRQEIDVPRSLYWKEVPSQVRAEDDAGNDTSASNCRPEVRATVSIRSRRSAASRVPMPIPPSGSGVEEHERDGSAHDVVAAVMSRVGGEGGLVRCPRPDGKWQHECWRTTRRSRVFDYAESIGIQVAHCPASRTANARNASSKLPMGCRFLVTQGRCRSRTSKEASVCRARRVSLALMVSSPATRCAAAR